MAVPEPRHHGGGPGHDRRVRRALGGSGVADHRSVHDHGGVLDRFAPARDQQVRLDALHYPILTAMPGSGKSAASQVPRSAAPTRSAATATAASRAATASSTVNVRSGARNVSLYASDLRPRPTCSPAYTSNSRTAS